jgi:osmotically inducible protein OsmC
MAVRFAQAVWEGTLREGKGTMKMASGAYEGAYSFSSRFEEGTGTNPEELIGAALAGCYSMQLSADLYRADHTAVRVETTAKVHLNRTDEGFRITNIHLEVEADVPDIEPEAFQQLAAQAKENCLVSRALAGTDVTLEAKLA